MENCDWIFALPYFLFATNSHYTNGSTQTPVIFRSWVLWCTSFSFFHSWIGNIWWLLQILHEPNSRCIFASSHPHLQIPVHFGHKYLFLAVMCNHISLRTQLSFCVNSIFHIYSLTEHNRICLCKAHMSATAQQSPLVQSWFYYAMIHQSGSQKAHIIFSGKNWKKKQNKKNLCDRVITVLELIVTFLDNAPAATRYVSAACQKQRRIVCFWRKWTAAASTCTEHIGPGRKTDSGAAECIGSIS